MGAVIRRICVSLLVVSFVFSGATWAACIDYPVAESSAASVVSAHDHHAAAAGHDVHHHADRDKFAGSDQEPPANFSHAHAAKCCSMVPAFSLAPNLSVTPAMFSVVPVSFHIEQRDLAGVIVSLDPGIPIRIVGIRPYR